MDMAVAVRESIVEDVEVSESPSVSEKELKKLSLEGKPNQCYRMTIQLGPHQSWSGMSGLGSKRGWEIKDDPSDDSMVTADAKYAVYDLTTDGKTLNGLIQGHNEFMDGLSRRQAGNAKTGPADLGYMLAVRQFKEIPGKLVGAENMFFGKIDRDGLKAHIREEARAMFQEMKAEEAADLAAKKARTA
jgi:hypothetical protein